MMVGQPPRSEDPGDVALAESRTAARRSPPKGNLHDDGRDQHTSRADAQRWGAWAEVITPHVADRDQEKEVTWRKGAHETHACGASSRVRSTPAMRMGLSHEIRIVEVGKVADSFGRKPASRIKPEIVTKG